ncbi:MAG: ATP-dependent exoDNAse (exonuclease V) beta subunit [Myxococcota bacterium]
MATVSLTASRADITAVAEQQARIHGVTKHECSAAVTLVEAALTHTLFDRARASERVERELPIAHRRADGVFIEGSADLVFWEGTRVVVVDYKTDLDVDERKQAYEVQLALYADALHAATGKTVLAIGLSV